MKAVQDEINLKEMRIAEREDRVLARLESKFNKRETELLSKIVYSKRLQKLLNSEANLRDVGRTYEADKVH